METLFVGRNIIFLPEIDSTNSYAINLLKNVKVSEGSIIHAANHTAGRGQRGNAWNALPNENLTVSVILKPSFLKLNEQFTLYQISALACYDLMTEILNTSQFDIKIKWPNDVLVNNRKIAGILIENIIQQDKINWSVLGIGINVNQTEFENRINASSLKIISGKEYKIDQIIERLCSHIEKYYLMLKSGKLSQISEQYLNCFYKLNEWHDFEIAGEKRNLKIIGTSNSGLLLLEDKNGEKREFDLKEVKWMM
jgi:BirA family transcriptional regulator, biotin operon repressor / biotin---[acetyl-CoA-carboxylase] ligase